MASKRHKLVQKTRQKASKRHKLVQKTRQKASKRHKLVQKTRQKTSERHSPWRAQKRIHLKNRDGQCVRFKYYYSGDPENYWFSNYFDQKFYRSQINVLRNK